MKLTPVLLVLSLIGNAVLAVALLESPAPVASRAARNGADPTPTGTDPASARSASADQPAAENAARLPTRAWARHWRSR